MAIDDDSEVKPDVRVVKPLRRGAAGASATASTAAAASTSTAAAAGRRPLAAKRTNTSTSTTTNARGAMAKAAAAAKATPAAVRVARKRREDAEARHRAAAAELKRAAAAQQDELEVEEQRQVKKLRTSEPEYMRAQREGDVDDEGEQAEDELEEEHDAEGPRMSKWETEVEARPKDHGWEDLDEGDEEDPLMVSAYVVEVYDYLRELEVRRRCRPSSSNPSRAPTLTPYLSLARSSRPCPSPTTCRRRTR